MNRIREGTQKRKDSAFKTLNRLSKQLMVHQLKEQLWAHIIVHNPDLSEVLDQDYGILNYLEDKVGAVLPLAEQMLAEGRPEHAAIELCMGILTEDLRPSRYEYILLVLTEDFSGDYARFKAEATVRYHALQMTGVCKDIFDNLDFKEENMHSNLVYQSILIGMEGYLITYR